MGRYRRLNLPNLVQMHGVEDRTLVMEPVEGENLKGPLSVDTAPHYALFRSGRRRLARNLKDEPAREFRDPLGSIVPAAIR